MNFIVSEKVNDGRMVLVITDSEIIGKKFEEGKKFLDLSGSFYKGEKMSEDAVKNIVKKAYLLHLTGQNAVNLGINLNLVDGNKVVIISGIPHAEVLIEE